mmetsp:Transcript_34839/g.57625  ORF Transcript_34839/g.57625 Transcript_34839/m.57625 type:complete len:381 (+) Transcript_34839:2-1144(+)
MLTSSFHTKYATANDRNAAQRSQTPAFVLPRECMQPGRWVRNISRNPAYVYYPNRHFDHTGDAQHLFRPSEGQPYRESLLWWWEPRYGSCILPTLDSFHACKRLRLSGIERVMFVGDSVSFMQAGSFHFITGGANTSAPRISVAAPTKAKFKPRLLCNRHRLNLELYYIRNDYLTLHRELDRCGSEAPGNIAVGSPQLGCSWDHGVKCRCHAWLPHYLNDSRRTLLVLNMGAHFHGFEPYRQAFEALVVALQTERIGRSRGDVVVFRTTPAGHAECDHFTKPVESEFDLAPIIGSVYENFGWQNFALFNEYAKYALAMATKNSVKNRGNAAQSAPMHILDVVPITSLRPDGHRDCLHYWLPGVVDWWNVLLFKGLRHRIP